MSLFVLVLFLLLRPNISLNNELCPEQNPSFLLTVDSIPIPDLKITGYKLSGTLEQLDGKVKCKTAIISRRMSQCDASMKLGNKCYSVDERVTLTEDDMETIWTRNECKIGFTCLPKHPCWGDDVTFCGDNPERRWSTPPYPISVQGQVIEKWFASTCIQEWGCDINEYEVQPTFDKKNQNLVVAYLPTGEKLDLNTNLPRDSPKRKGSPRTRCEQYKLTNEFVEFDCFKNDQQLACFGKLQDGEQVFLTNVNVEGCVHIQGNKRFYLDCTNKSNIKISGMSYENDLSPDSTANIQTIYKIMRSIIFTQQQSIFNVIQVYKSIKEMNHRINKFLSRLAYNDPHLLAWVMDSSFITEPITPNVFEATMCLPLPVNKSYLSNCYKDKIWEKQFWRLKRQNDSCITLNEEKIRKIKLIFDYKINEDLIEEIQVDESSYLKYIRNKISDKEYVPKSKEDNRKEGNFPLSITIWDKVTNFIDIVTIYLPWINFIIIMRFLRS